MPLKMAELEEPQLNLTPMIDIVFNLIIFFIVSMQFSNEQQFDVQLPSSSNAQPLTSPPDEIIVNVLADGRVAIKDEILTLDQLRTMLSDAQARYADQAVLVRGDGRGVLQHTVNVFSVCRAARIENFSLATQPPEGAP